MGARIPNTFGFRMVQSCSIGEWFGFRMVWTKWLPFCSDFEWFCSVFECSVFEWSVPVHRWWYWNGWNGPFEIRTIPIQNMKTFGIRMDSVFECSVFEPPLYSLLLYSESIFFSWIWSPVLPWLCQEKASIWSLRHPALLVRSSSSTLLQQGLLEHRGLPHGPAAQVQQRS